MQTMTANKNQLVPVLIYFFWSFACTFFFCVVPKSVVFLKLKIKEKYVYWKLQIENYC